MGRIVCMSIMPWCPHKSNRGDYNFVMHRRFMSLHINKRKIEKKIPERRTSFIGGTREHGINAAVFVETTDKILLTIARSSLKI